MFFFPSFSSFFFECAFLDHDSPLSSQLFFFHFFFFFFSFFISLRNKITDLWENKQLCSVLSFYNQFNMNHGILNELHSTLDLIWHPDTILFMLVLITCNEQTVTCYPFIFLGGRGFFLGYLKQMFTSAANGPTTVMWTSHCRGILVKK